MAFAKAAGWGNLPSGNFSPVIYSKQVQLAFRKSAICSEITGTDYFGEIAGQGDTVRILKEPDITVTAYARGATISAQNLADDDFSLVVDKANTFSFMIEDIEEAHSHVNFAALAQNKAGYRLADQFDMECLGYLSGFKQSALGAVANTINTTISGTKADTTAGTDELLATMKLNKASFGSITTAGAANHSIPIAARLPGATSLPTATVSPAMVVSKMATKLDKQNVDKAGRWLVVSPDFVEILMDEDSRLFNSQWGESGGIRNGVLTKNFYGFRVYVSNNLPSVGTGPDTNGTANQNANYGVIVAGVNSAVATAEQINKVESFRSQGKFADVIRGLHLYGRKILRPEALVNAKYNIA